MSLVYITKHNENIYNLNKFDRGAAEDKLILQIINNTLGNRYISKYHNKVINKNFDIINIDPYNKIISTKPGIGRHRTMGKVNEPLKCPCNFLHKNEGIKWKRKKEHICEKSLHPIPSVPKVSELLLEKKLKVEENIIKKNIENVRNAPVRRPNLRFAFTSRGATHEVCNSGLMPAHIYSTTFGKLPKYILKYNKISCDKQKECEEYQRQIQRQKHTSDYNILDPNERIQILDGMKKRWIEMQKNFQTLPVCTDILLKRQRKNKLEMQLRQLEDDIVLIEKNPRIYICA